MQDSVHERHAAYWARSLRIVLLVLTLWFLVSLGCGVLFRGWLDRVLPSIGGAPFGFWIAQQGAIVVFIGLLILYMTLMNRLDDDYHYSDDDEEGVGESGVGPTHIAHEANAGGQS